MAAIKAPSVFEVLVMSAMFNALFALVPCAYSTIGRGPEHAGAAPVGTMSAPEDLVVSPAPPRVQNVM
jgi:hypothetical protein